MGIRVILLHLLVAGLCVLALLRPHIGFYAYIWYALMRPDVLAFVEPDSNWLSLALAVCTSIGSVRKLGGAVNIFTNPFSRMVVLLQIPVFLSTILAVRPELTYDRYGQYIRMIVVLLLAPVLIQTLEHLHYLLLVVAGSLGFVGLKYGVYGVIHGGADLASGYGPMLADNNFVALALATVIPMCWYARFFCPWRSGKMILLGMVAASIAGIVMTNSRGGVLAMMCGLLMIVMRTRHRMAALLVLVLFLGGSIYLVQDMFMSRMSTLSNYEEEASALSRIHHMKAAVAMWLDYPFLGVGFGGFNYALLSSRYSSDVTGRHVAHNSWVQMLVDSGIFAFVIYVSLFVYTIIWLQGSERRWKHVPEHVALIRGIQTALVVFALGSTFYSCHRMDIPYILVLCAGGWYSVEKILSTSGARQPAGSGAGIVPAAGRRSGLLEHPATARPGNLFG